MPSKALPKPPNKPRPHANPSAPKAGSGAPAKGAKPAKVGVPARKSTKPSGGKPTGKSDLGGKQVGSKPNARKAAARSAQARPAFVPRATAHIDDDDVLMAHGGGGGGFGRCGGRFLASRTEQQLCHRLGLAGVVHSHSPRHYEVRYTEGRVAAYAPMIVLRGRGREGKSVVIEAVEEAEAPILRKVVAFRSQYGQEFYVILVAPDDLLDEVPLASHDESCSATNVNTLIARLAE